MVAPLDLNTEEFEIYRLLYVKADFETMLVRYTLEQLATDSNSKLLLTKKKVSTIIKKFISEKFISIIKKGSKGNATLYEINKIKDINLGTQRELKRNLKGTQRKLKSNLKPSTINGLDTIEELKGNLKETQKELKGNSKVPPINDIEKDKEIDNIYITVINYLNIKADTKYKNNTKKTKSSIDARLNDGFILEDFKTVIDNKVASWKDNIEYSKYLRPETLFGNKFESYLNEKCKINVKKEKGKYNADNDVTL